MTQLKDAMACFCTGVTVITTHFEGRDWGMTCNSFNTVSLDPAMVLWSIRTTSSSRGAFKASGGYTVNILSGAQRNLAMQFTRGSQAERFANIELVRVGSQRPRIVGSLAWFDCNLESAMPAGDHDIMLGRVLDFGMNADTVQQALYYAGHQFGSLQLGGAVPTQSA